MATVWAGFGTALFCILSQGVSDKPADTSALKLAAAQPRSA